MEVDIITLLHELKVGIPSLIQDIADGIQRDAIGFALQIRNCGFLLDEFLVTIGIPDHCIDSMSLVLRTHEYQYPESIASLDRESLLTMNLKIGLRVKLLRGVALLRYVGYGSQPSG